MRSTSPRRLQSFFSTSRAPPPDGLQLHRPRGTAELLAAPEPLQDHAHVPVAHRVAEEEEVARLHLRHQRERNLVADVRAGEVVDVAVLGEDVAVALDVAAVDRTVQLQDRPAAPRAPARCTCSASRSASSSRRAGDAEASLARAGLCLVPDDVELLAGLVERTLDEVVVVRGQYEQLLAVRARAERRKAREQPVKRGRRVVGIEDGVELLVQRPRHRAPRRSTAKPTAGRDRRGSDSGSSRRARGRAHGRSGRSVRAPNPPSPAGRKGSPQRQGTGTTSPSASNSAMREKWRSSTFTSLPPIAPRLGRHRFLALPGLDQNDGPDTIPGRREWVEGNRSDSVLISSSPAISRTERPLALTKRTASRRNSGE